MSRFASKFRWLRPLDVLFVRPKSDLNDPGIRFYGAVRRFCQGISFKLALLIISLMSVGAVGSALIVINILDDVLFQSMVRRGAAIASAGASTAGYSIMADDRLALDNLASRITVSQADLDYVAVIDVNNSIRAHTRVELSGGQYRPQPGQLISNNLGVDLHETTTNGVTVYEFSQPILFADKVVGQILVGLNASALEQARSAARNRIILMTLLLFPFAVAGAYILSKRFTHPVRELAKGVSMLEAGNEQVVVPITSNDELADLTISFNEMSRKLTAQRNSLINYSEELERSYSDIVHILAAALDARDNYTYGHSSRVARLSVEVGRRLDLKPYELKDLEMSCLLHDIGKIKVPDAILNKPEKLSDEQYRMIKDHPLHGVEILELAASLKKYIPAVKHHHEWHDGSGYPGRLAGDEIPLYARILSIADAYDAMTTSRPYRQGLSKEEAVDELVRFKGRQFEPGLVDMFLLSLEECGDLCDMPLTAGV